MGISAESTVWLFSPLFPVRIGIWKCWFLWREETGEPGENGLGAEMRANNKLNPHMKLYDAETGNRTRATLVGDECSHH